MSETYRQSSIEDEAKEKLDSSNQWLWRMNRRKLSAEEMRDSVLMVSGKLNLEMGSGFYLFNLEHTAHSLITTTINSTRKMKKVIVGRSTVCG